MPKDQAKKAAPSQLEQNVAAFIKDIAAGTEDAMKKSVSKLEISAVKEVRGEKVFIITVPYKQIALCRQIQGFLAPELEKKLGGQVIFVGKRRAFPIKPEEGRRYRVVRPVARTLRSVNEALLEDVCYPTAIVGKQVHYNLKGKQNTVVFLDSNDRTRVEDRLQGYAAAYTQLTGIHTTFQVAQN